MSISNASSFLDTFAAAKNKIINGDFSIWNRGTASLTNANNSGYTADRWQIGVDGSGATVTCTQQSFTPGAAPVSGYEGRFFLRITATTAGTASYFQIAQKIEDVRTFAGQTVTMSFWAKADTTRSGLYYIEQTYGNGGSGTFTVPGYPSVTYSTTWTRYSTTFTVPSTIGKTIGTDHYMYLGIRCNMTAGAYLDIWGVQLEAGSSPTSFTTCSGTAGGEALLCQRYLPYFGGNVGNNSFLGFSYSTTGSQFFGKLPVTARTNPTGIVISNLSHFYVYNSGFSTGTPTGITWNNGGPETFTFNAATTAGSPTISQNQPVGFVFNNTAASMYLLGCEFQ